MRRVLPRAGQTHLREAKEETFLCVCVCVCVLLSLLLLLEVAEEDDLKFFQLKANGSKILREAYSWHMPDT